MSRLLFVLLICPTLALGQQRQLPNDVDLKAAYCIPIARYASQTTVNENLPEPFRNGLQDVKDKGAVNLRRLNLYLFPRLSQLDIEPLFAASKSGEEDWERMTDEIRQCDKISPVKEALKCKAFETEATKRLRSCNVLSFLPF